MLTQPLEVLEFFRTASLADARRTLDIAAALLVGRENGIQNKPLTRTALPPSLTPPVMILKRKIRSRRKRQPDSIRAWSKQVLEKHGQPMHANQIYKRLATHFGCEATLQTVVGGIARLVKAEDTFTRTAPNTFGLIEWERKTNGADP